MKTLERHYDKLTAAERAALTVDALARRDMAEADRLAASCPEFNYRSKDLAYVHRLSTLHYLAQVYEAAVLSRRVQHMAVVFNMVRDKTGDVDSAEAMFIRAQRLAGSIEAWHLAWDIFCAEVGFDPDAVLRAYGIEQPAIPTSKAAEPAREQIDAAASMLRELWCATMGSVAGNGARQ